MTLETLPKVDIPVISEQELSGLLAAGEDIILLDIRLGIDARRYWIDAPRRLHFTLDELTERYAEIPRGQKLAVIDTNGKRAGLAARYLTARGFDRIVTLGGGMNQWMKAGMPTKMAQ